ncbi:MAG: hypothetical protein VB957_10065 [Pseudomonadales bacterium]
MTKYKELFISLLFALSVVLPLSVSAQDGGPTIIKKEFNVTFNPVKEMSGIVKSKRFEDVFWVHNDSGDEPRLFAIDGKGKVIYPSYLSVHGEIYEEGKKEWQGHKILVSSNYDWEDITVDEDMIYISDMGNNGNARRDLGVYVLFEPNPRAVPATRMLKYLPIRYPEQKKFPAEKWHYDSEALFNYRGKLYFITKHRVTGKISEFEKGAVLYRLDTQYTDKVNVLTRVDTHSEVAVVTGADLSPDGSKLAVLCYRQLWVFDKPRRGDNFFASSARMISLDFKETAQVEAVAWADDETIFIANEGREVFSVLLKDMSAYTN